MDGRPLDTPAWNGASTSLADELLRPSVIYAPAVVAIKKAIGNALHGVAHITGGGIVGNIPRMLPSHLDAAVDLTAFETPEIFFEIQRRGRVAADEMLRVFNCGLGMVLAVAPSEVESVIALAHEHGVVGTEIGAIRPGDGQVVLL
jgi:phosphoribosylformylglycinamidine cyclo-ligase